jgi:hypothetical protein
MKYLKEATIVNITEADEVEIKNFIEKRFSHFNMHFEIQGNDSKKKDEESFPFNLFKKTIETIKSI